MIKFLIAIFLEWEGRLTWNERDVSWIQCCMHNGLVLGHSAWQKVRPSNGSMWNSYSFQPIGPWMGYSFTDLGAEGCCRSLNALLISQFWILIHYLLFNILCLTNSPFIKIREINVQCFLKIMILHQGIWILYFSQFITKFPFLKSSKLILWWGFHQFTLLLRHFS